MNNNERSSLAIPIWGLFIISLLSTLYFAKAIFIPIFLATFIAFMLSPLIEIMRKFYVPRALGSAIIIIALSSLVVVSANYLAEPAADWLERFPAEIGEIQKKLLPFKDSIESVQKTTDTVKEMASMTPDNSGSGVVVEGPNIFYTLLDGTQELLISTLSFVVLLYFMLAFGQSLGKRLGAMLREQGVKTNIMRITRDVQHNISRYLLLITAINIVLGVIVAIVMWALGMPTPAVWGASAAFFNFIPYVGPAINIGIITMVSLMTFDSLTQILLPPALLLALNLLEGQFIQPLFIGRMFTINPVIIFLFVLIWGWLWGMAGIFMAVPLLVAGEIILNQIMKPK
jgi:predicted PurR-regulated permease PerM